MRKLSVFILLVLCSSVFAQDRLIKPEAYIGVTGGVSESMVLFTPTVSQGLLQGYNGGIVFRYIAEKNVGMQAELNFSQRGWKESSGLYSRRLNYIELPFMTHIYIGKKNRFFINLGPKVSYLLSEKTILNKVSNSSEKQQTDPVDNSFDYGLCMGLGVLFNIHGNNIQLETRGNYSLNDVFPSSKIDYFSDSHNMYFSVNLGWLLKMK